MIMTNEQRNEYWRQVREAEVDRMAREQDAIGHMTMLAEVEHRDEKSNKIKELEAQLEELKNA